MVDRCMKRDASATGGEQSLMKAAAGISIFLLEELGDARLRCVQLKAYIDEARQLIENSEQRDHFFEVAAHLIHGIPECLLKMEKALDTAALAAARLDYEEIKDDLRPEKVEQLERALEDVRIRHVKRRSGETPQDSAPRKDNEAMNAKTAAEQLNHIAAVTEATGQVPLASLLNLIAKLETGRDKTASVPNAAALAGHFRGLASELGKNLSEGRAPSRLKLAAHLRTLYANTMTPTSAQMAAAIYQQAGSREEVMKGFKESNPSMSEADLEKAADMWEQNKNVVKDKS
jgi:hypothetical protein